ncbi:MAG: ABC transporter permease, partial [Alphaproteobacteria bacterium]|nr:ABC transporter permease [Alphaproteobacteria bacterium]
MDQASLFSLLSFGPDGWGMRFVEGLVVTVEVSVAAYCISLILGLIGAGAKLSNSKVVRGIADLYTTFVRALP